MTAPFHSKSPLTPEALDAACARIKHVALDMDGTIYLGSQLFPFTGRFLERLTEMGIGYSFLTNNPTRSTAGYIAKLAAMGIDATPEQVYTSATATIDWLRQHMPEARTLFTLGTPEMQDEFREAGYTLTSEADGTPSPDALIVAFDTTLVYPRLCRAAYLAAQGIPYIATNPDRVCPTDRPVILPDCGSICAAIEHATGRRPDIVIGKPNPDMLAGIRYRHGLEAADIAMCGDRIYTDVEMARRAGALGVLVLSGESTMDDALAAPHMPDIVARDIDAFADLLEKYKG